MDAGSQQSQSDAKLRQYEALLEVAESIATRRDLSSLLQDLALRLQRIVSFDVVALALHDSDLNVMRVSVIESSALAPGRISTQLPVEESPSGFVWQTQEPLLMVELDVFETRYPRAISEFKKSGIKTIYILPLTSAGRRLGALGFGSIKESPYGKDDLDLLGQVARLTAAAVDNGINFEEAIKTQRRFAQERERCQLLLEVSNAVVSNLSLKDLLMAVSACLRRFSKHDLASMAIYDEESDRLHIHALEGPILEGALVEGTAVPLEGTPPGLAVKTRATVIRDRIDFNEFHSPVMRQAYEMGLRSGCSVPLISHDRVLGTINIGGLREAAFTREDAELLEQIAGQVAIGVENALNFERARRAEGQAARERDRIRLSLETNNAVISHLDLKELVKAISAILRDIIPHDAAGIALYEPEINQLREYMNVTYKPMDNFRIGETIPLEGTQAGQVFLTGRPLRIQQRDRTKYPADRLNNPGVDIPKSALLAPLISHGRTLGIVGVSSTQEGNFTEEDLELLSQIANQIAIAVENAQNFESARAAEELAKLQSERRQLLLEINNAVVSHLDLRDLVRVISKRLREMLRHDVTGISLYDPETNLFRAYMFDLPESLPAIEEGAEMPVEGTIGGLAFSTGQPVFMGRYDPDATLSEFDRRLMEKGIKSGGCIPLVAHERKLGILGVGSFRADAFSEADQELLCHIANQIAIAVENALAYREIETLKNKLASEKLYLEDEIRTEHNFDELIGSSPSFKRILKQIETVAPTDSAVLIRGETGTGKELIARAIHNLSARRERTLVKLNCAAIPTGLLESELFGHEKGAFTGAIAQRAGRFELANRGTLFLDEVGDIPLELQPKLLRVLQEQEFERLGSTRTQKVDVRLIAATNCDLEQLVADKKYRSDLFYRLNVFPVTIPPLRERVDDIPPLVRFFTQKYSRRLKKRIESIPTEVMNALTRYHWPGNVRELEHFIERAVVLTQGEALEVSLSEIKPSATPASINISTLVDAEREHILRALEESNWVIGGPNGAAVKLGMKRTTLQSKMQKLDISRQK